MLFETPLRLLVLLIAGSLALAKAQSPPPKPSKVRATNLAVFARTVVGHAEKLELLDDLTETKSETTIGPGGPVRPEGVWSVVTYRVTDLELSKSLTNSIWLLGNVPGRTVSTSIRTDCLVHEWFPAPNRARDPANPGTLLIRLPQSTKLTAQFPDDATASTDLGELRWEFLGDDKKAKRLRDELYAEAQDLAVVRFREYRAAERDGFASEIGSELQAQHPGKPVRVERDGGGYLLGIERYFPEPTKPADEPERKWDYWFGATVVLGLFSLSLLILGFIRRRA